MNAKNKSKSGPRPVTIKALTPEDALDRSQHPVTLAMDALSSVEHAQLLELAAEYFDYPMEESDDKGGDKGSTPRIQEQPEIIVLVVEHLKSSLEDLGLGASVINGSPQLYCGTHWVAMTEGECTQLLGWFAEHLGYNIVQSRFFLLREKLLQQFLSQFSDQGALTEDTSKRILINFKNGTLEIANGKELLREFRMEDYLTYQLPFAYHETAGCPMFDRFVARVLPDPTSQAVVAEFFGWLFLRELKLEKILVLFGDGHNGKSVLFEITNALLGEQNVSNMGLSSLTKPENRVMLANALLNFGSEISSRCDVDLLKKLASGEPIEARKLYRDVFIMRNYARLAFNANVLPRNTEQTTGFFRRFLIIPFNVTITEEEKDPDLASKIITGELPGVFNWVMRGLRRLRDTRKFTECQAALEALDTYRKEADSVAMFLEDNSFESSIDGRLGKDDLYVEYRNYCSVSGYHSLSKNNFGKRIKSQHHITESKSGACRFWHLIRGREEE